VRSGKTDQHLPRGGNRYPRLGPVRIRGDAHLREALVPLRLTILQSLDNRCLDGPCIGRDRRRILRPGGILRDIVEKRYALLTRRRHQDWAPIRAARLRCTLSIICGRISSAAGAAYGRAGSVTDGLSRNSGVTSPSLDPNRIPLRKKVRS